jgi:hypothetical protein
MLNYIKDTEIVAAKFDDTAKPRMTPSGYTQLSGSPTDIMVKLSGVGHWRRVYVVQISNVPSYHIKIKGENRPVSDCTVEYIRELAEKRVSKETEWMMEGFMLDVLNYSTDGQYRTIDR